MQNESQQPSQWIIIVNAQKHPWDKERISYSDVVKLAFPDHHKDDTMFTVQYSHGPEQNPQGTLVDGKDAYVKMDMIFDVTRTDKS